MARIALNDLSFDIKYASKLREKEAIRIFYEVFTELHDQKYHSVDKIYGNYPRYITDFSLKGKVEDYLSHDKISYLLALLSQLIPVPDEKVSVSVKEINRASFCCGWAKNGIVISIPLSDFFSNDLFECMDSDMNEVQIRNIASPKHIEKYELELGRRKYEHNVKHRDKKYQRSGGKNVSIAIPAEKAQGYLDKAVQLDSKSKKLYYYDRDTDKYYVFLCTEKNIYHGFQDENLDNEVCSKVRELLSKNRYGE